MKKALFVMMMAFGSVVAFAQQNNDLPQLTFTVTEHDFGKIQEGTMANFEFTFTNTGKAPLVLSNVQPSCGCTTPEWNKDPIMPGGKGSIKASFNSYGRPGTFQKYITVKSNAGNGEVMLTIKGTVEPKPIEPVSPVRNTMTE